ncbi:VOC family protein [Rhodococcoides kyotonense]|uniref:Catechol 2,3-dioxygenase n=1 Tax=Rhodococcoides kyotonense TaxID=398843 RepID=A0A239ME11_9NOCA|nr:VOC family protein [Rhodococcus kyotonensis]SNT40324.1 Catechol 2,3-dioxygenase [Rhodococcus kyotonensis]
MLLDGINHVAVISGDIERLKSFCRSVFEADIGPTKPHGEDGGETMAMIKIGPHTELDVVTIEGNHEADRQTPTWGRGRLGHLGLQAASREAFETICQRLVEHGAGDGTVNAFGGVLSRFFRDPDGLEGEVLVPKSARN